MKKEKAKELSKILLDYSEGKIIQRFICNNWYDLSELSASDLTSFDLEGKYYPLRIKPEPKLIPFTFEDNLLFRDKWIYHKLNKVPEFMKIISYNESNIHTEFGAVGYEYFLKDYCFEDGSPCGKYINE